MASLLWSRPLHEHTPSPLARHGSLSADFDVNAVSETVYAMIWYLLYPFRGTTEAPILGNLHPLRIAFTRYGRYAARHVLTTLLVSTAVACVLIYPIPFLYSTDFITGASNVPLHVWTDAQPVREQALIEPDVIMRTIWVHGSYMQALNRDVLLGALELQDEILGTTVNFQPRRPKGEVVLVDPAIDLTPPQRDTFHVINGITNQSWFFHSPLQYWSCHDENIIGDADILNTVNQRKTQPTSVNVTLRHSIVFSGKQFEDRKLIAADALVITLIHLRDSPVGRQWARKTEQVAARMTDKWEIYPKDGVPWRYQLYEFQFRPLSYQDSTVLTLAYIMTLSYLFISLAKIRAVKSKLGLVLTVLSQIVLSILSSLTVCALLRIDISRIPRAAYALVLMSMSVENMFRLINAVILTPADHSTSSRIGHAFGGTAHIALATVVQNLCILWGLSKIVSPGVAAFCKFAAIAITFDFFYLSTFFLSVLSVDVRRMELSDALEKAASRRQRSTSDAMSRYSLLDALLHGRIALSTRIAGTVVMLGFVFVAQWHFSSSLSSARALSWFWRLLGRPSTDLAKSSEPHLSSIHQARSPTSWLRLQDHLTAKEVINVVKPWAHSYVARVYDPVVFVLRGADRNPSVRPRWFPDAVYDFAHHQLTPFVVTVLVLVAAVRLLLNFLLWDEFEGSDLDDDSDDDSLLTVQDLSRGHKLDVALLQAANDGQLVSVGWDRLIRVWNIHYPFVGHIVNNAASTGHDPFPILAMATDEESRWLAFLSNNKLLLWNLNEQRWGPMMVIDFVAQKPELFFFGSTTRNEIPSLVVLKRGGTIAEYWPGTREAAEYMVCVTPLTCVVFFAHRSTRATLSWVSCVLALSRHGTIHRIVQNEDCSWSSQEVRFAETGDDSRPHTIVPIPALTAYLVARSRSVDLVDLTTSKMLHTFETESMQPHSLQSHFHLRKHPQNATPLISSFSLVYKATENGDCVSQSWLPGKRCDAIALEDGTVVALSEVCTWTGAQEFTWRISNPGQWTVLRNGCIVGVRKKRAPEATNSSTKSFLGLADISGSLRRRKPLQPAGTSSHGSPSRSTRQIGADDGWEVWAETQIEHKEEFPEVKNLSPPENGGGLMVTELGPITKLGYGSLAIGLGNIIKIVTLGRGRFEGARDDFEDDSFKAPPKRPRHRGRGNSRGRTA